MAKPPAKTAAKKKTSSAKKAPAKKAPAKKASTAAPPRDPFAEDSASTPPANVRKDFDEKLFKDFGNRLADLQKELVESTAEINGDIADVLKEAKEAGLNVRELRAAVKRKTESAERRAAKEEREARINGLARILGMKD